MRDLYQPIVGIMMAKSYNLGEKSIFDPFVMAGKTLQLLVPQ
jgi:hypothetical protein